MPCDGHGTVVWKKAGFSGEVCLNLFFCATLVDVSCEDEDALLDTQERIHGVLFDGVLIEEHGAVTRISNVEPALKTWVNGESGTFPKANGVHGPQL